MKGTLRTETLPTFEAADSPSPINDTYKKKVYHTRTSDDTIDYHSARYLPLLVRDKATNTMQQVVSETLEWQTDTEVLIENLSSDEADLDIRAPVSWSDRVSAFTNLFSPFNRIVLLARIIANLKTAAGESVDTCGLRVTQAYARLLAEAKRTAPTNVSPYKHAWQTMATFESGLLPLIRVELIREDLSVSYRASHTHAKNCLLYTSPSPRDKRQSRMPSSA